VKRNVGITTIRAARGNIPVLTSKIGCMTPRMERRNATMKTVASIARFKEYRKDQVKLSCSKTKLNPENH
jgi:hypothetical protein